MALTAATVLLRLPAYFSAKHLTFDDGVFASSILAMRDGGLPFRDVFSSQGPLFLPLVYLGDLVGFRTMDAPRIVPVLSGVIVVLAVHWAALRFTDRIGALIGAGLAATSGCLMWVTGPIAADGPALAFATLAFALGLRHRGRPTYPNAILLGLAVGATLSNKAMEAPILLPVVLVLGAPILDALRHRVVFGADLARAAVAGGVAALMFVAISAPFGFADVWDQSFVYRNEASNGAHPAANAGKILSTLWDRDLVLLLFCAVALVFAVLAFRRTGSARVAIVDADDNWASATSTPVAGWRPSSRLLVTSWVIVSALWLIVVVSPMWRAHVSAMIPPLALLVALYRPPLKPAVVAAVVSIPLLFVQLDGLLLPGDYEGSEAEVVELLRGLPDGAWVLSDEPGLVWRAGHRTSDDLVDPSMLRVQQGRYTEQSLADAAADPRVCAVVVRSDDRFGHFPGLPDRLAAEGYEVALRSSAAGGDAQRVYVRQDCAPSG
ncbi:hypothetical protein BH10ACT3_BH10ACT3_01390 [soil metagenome]